MQPHDKLIRVRPGDRVVCLENDYKKEVYNGDIGTVLNLEDSDVVKVCVACLCLQVWDGRLPCHFMTHPCQLRGSSRG